MRFKNSITKNIVEPINHSNLNNATGEILEYYAEHNAADVFVAMLKDAEGITLEKVPIQLTSQGIRTPSLKVGDIVYVAFNNNSVFQPKIIGLADEDYVLNTREKQRHIKQGQLVPSSNFEEGTVTTPSYKTWLNIENEELFETLPYMNKSPADDAINILSQLGYFKESETALINTDSLSIVKIKGEGTIEIFINNNTGIRVNSNTKTIEILGDTSTISDNWSVLSNNINIVSNDTLKITSNKIEVDTKNFILNGRSINNE